MKNILYITDQIIYLFYNKTKKIYKIAMPKNVIVNGRIANINKFISKFEKVQKENGLNNGLIGEKIKIIVHSKYTQADITILKNIFEKLNYRNISVENEMKYYKLDDNNAWINICESYILVTYKDEYNNKVCKLIENNFFKTSSDLYKYIKTNVGNKDIYLIGYGKLLDNFYNEFEKIYKNKVYTFSDKEYYLLDCIVKL